MHSRAAVAISSVILPTSAVIRSRIACTRVAVVVVVRAIAELFLRLIGFPGRFR